MTCERNDIEANLGSGSFKVDRLTQSYETVVSEAALLEGGFNRTVLGGRLVLVLEGSYGVARDGAFFRGLCAGLEGSVISGAVIGGVTYGELYAAKAVVAESRDSAVGRFVITLKRFAQ